MKINWGTSIVIAFVLFIGFILFFVVKSHQKQYKHDLVSEEYYKDELKYQNEIDQLQNVKDLTEEFEISKTTSGFEILFPSQFTNANIDGIITMSRPSNKQLDFSQKIHIENQKVHISKEKLTQGFWDLKIEFESENKRYLVKESLNY